MSTRRSGMWWFCWLAAFAVVSGWAGQLQAQPALQISKSVSSEVTKPGAQLVYTLNIANSGDQAATNVIVTDDLNPLVNFSSATGGGGIGTQDPQGAVVTWRFAAIAPGQSGSVSIVAAVNPATPGTSFDNVASIASDQTPFLLSNNVDVRIDTDPNLFLSKVISRDQALPGDTIVYTLNYFNLGGRATNVILTDALALGLSYIEASASGNGSYDAVSRTLSWSSARLESGQSGAVTFAATVDAVADGTVIENTARIESAQTVSLASNSVSVTVSSEAAITVEIPPPPGPTAPGDVVQFTATINNVSTNVAENLTVTAPEPANTRYLSNLGGGVLNGGNVTWNLGSLGPGQSTSVVLVVEVDQGLSQGDEIEFEASATISNGPPDGAALIVKIDPAPEFTLSKSASAATVDAGEAVTYTLAYANTGSAATATVLRDYLPANTRFIAASNGGRFDNGLVTWELGTIAAGAGGTVDLTLELDAPLQNGTVLQNVATVESLFGFPVTATAAVTVSSLPDLVLMKTTAQAVVTAGDQLLYQLELRNAGASRANNIRVTDILPADVSYVDSSDQGSQTAPGVVTWSLDSLDPGGRRLLFLTVRVNAVVADGTVLQNTATVISDETEPALAPVVDTLVASLPVLGLTKQARQQEVTPNGNVLYTLDYQNNGSDQATGAVITDIVPAGTTFVRASADGVYDPVSNSVSWPLGAVPAGSNGTVTLVVAIDAATLPGTVVANTAVIASDQTPPVVANAQVSVVRALPRPVPTLSQVMLLLLVVMLMAVAARTLRGGF